MHLVMTEVVWKKSKLAIRSPTTHEMNFVLSYYYPSPAVVVVPLWQPLVTSGGEASLHIS